MADLKDEFLAFETVQRFAESLKDRTPEERDERLGLLQEFATLVDRTPDQMVDELFDKETMKYRKRGFYTERIKEFSAQVPGSWNQQNARGNVIRAFFIANGYRIPPEKPPWM